MHHVRRMVASALLLWLASACYRYHDVPADALQPGARIRARLSAAEAQQLTEQLGAPRRVLEGQVIAADATAVTIEVPSSLDPSTATAGFRQRVSVPPGSIVELQARELDRMKTVGLIAAGAAAVVAAALAIDGGLLGGGGDKNGGEANVIIGRIVLPR